jgi:hypothetical protein
LNFWLLITWNSKIQQRIDGGFSMVFLSRGWVVEVWLTLGVVISGSRSKLAASPAKRTAS